MNQKKLEKELRKKPKLSDEVWGLALAAIIMAINSSVGRKRKKAGQRKKKR